MTVWSPDTGYLPILVPITVELHDSVDVDTVTIELLNPQPDPEGPGFGEAPPLSTTTSLGPLRPHVPTRFPERLAMAGKDPVTVRYTVRRGEQAWTGTAQIEMPYDMAQSFG